MNKNFSKQKWLLYIGICVMLAFNACGHKDSCDIPCYNGVCVNNSCNCDLGYEGDSCTIRNSDKFIGTWNAVDSCETNTYGYTVTIAASSSTATEFIISNFGEYGISATVEATISGNTFTVTPQNVQNNSITLSGNGTINTTINTITVNYLAEDVITHLTDACSGIWTKVQ